MIGQRLRPLGRAAPPGPDARPPRAGLLRDRLREAGGGRRGGHRVRLPSWLEAKEGRWRGFQRDVWGNEWVRRGLASRERVGDVTNICIMYLL